MEWFSPEAARWFSLLSLLSVLAGTSYWIEKGQRKALVTGLFRACLGLGAVLLIASLVARVVEQPAHVIRALTLTGVILTLVFGAMQFVVYQGYAKADERKMLAKDI